MTMTANARRVRVGHQQPVRPLAELTAADLVGPVGAAIGEDATLWEALRRFLTQHTRHLAVVDGRRRYRGLLSDRHLAARAPFDERSLRSLRVRDIGCLDRPALAPGTSLTAVARLLTDYEADALPVVDAHGEVLGVVTRDIVVRALADRGPDGRARPAPRQSKRR
ncbi:CBS domain-containing protein [Streptantibioticus ferralitis]|uniref:CBS domain-containing protein n=1 Tax=Streptantibioticus ferralitis TaxID=236510 RepID=A0ABT5YTS0_9ACTN|nr:CBS domain-containing protein [Streptantibioticus ferralitis]MDF2254954.1 CBS domain-containing protein [Streptantibioticus ferralitis]